MGTGVASFGGSSESGGATAAISGAAAEISGGVVVSVACDPGGVTVFGRTGPVVTVGGAEDSEAAGCGGCDVGCGGGSYLKLVTGVWEK